MDGEAFHEGVCRAMRDGFAEWDWKSNPLEWERIPARLSDLMLAALKDALEDSRMGVFGAPFHIDYGEVKRGVLAPNPDTFIKIELHPYSDSDEFAGARFNLADAIIKDAETAEAGWTVGHAINQLEATIAKLKREAETRGWDTSTYDTD